MNKCVIITGASSGIGKSLVQEFAKNNYNIIAIGRDTERTNASSSENCEKIAAFSVKEFGRIDVVINCAGIIFRSDAKSTTDQQWDDTIATNLSGPFFLSRATLPELIKNKGAIINIASDWGLQGGKQAVAYCASKGGLVLMTKAMALDHADVGVRINAICPGDVDTPMLKTEADQRDVNYDEAMVSNNSDSPTGRITRPSEVASLAAYLASSSAAQITGTTISIDGGNTA